MTSDDCENSCVPLCPVSNDLTHLFLSKYYFLDLINQGLI